MPNMAHTRAESSKNMQKIAVNDFLVDQTFGNHIFTLARISSNICMFHIKITYSITVG